MTPQASNDIDELTRQVISHAYATFCAEQHMRPSPSAAERFAVSVTESGAKPYHGVPSAALVQLLTREFPEKHKARKH
jgi:hypothetical protein